MAETWCFTRDEVDFITECLDDIWNNVVSLPFLHVNATGWRVRGDGYVVKTCKDIAVRVNVQTETITLVRTDTSGVRASVGSWSPSAKGIGRIHES